MNKNYAPGQFCKSGETELFEALQTELAQILKTSNAILDPEDFLDREGGLNEKFRKCLSCWRDFPSSRYMINYLCSSFGCVIEKEKVRNKLFDELEAEEPLSDNSMAVVKELAQQIWERYNSGEDADSPFSVDDICEKLIHLDEEFFLYYMAPVLGMSQEDVEVFLTRVFNRDKLDLYKPEEFLLAIVLKNPGSFYGVQNGTEILLSDYQAFNTLCRLYNSITEFSKSSVKDTRYIQSRVYGGERICLYPEADSELLDDLRWHKRLMMPEKRTVTKKMEALLKEVKESYKSDIERYERLSLEGKKKEKLADKRRSMVGTLEISYLPDREVKLSRDVIFRADGQNDYEISRSELDGEGFAVLPSMKKAVNCLVHVVPVSLEPRSLLRTKSGNIKRLPAGKKLSLSEDFLDLMAEGNISNIRTYRSGEAHSSKMPSPCYCKAAESNNLSSGGGYILLDCDFGYKIPKGIRLVYEEKGNIYEFVLDENFTAPRYPHKEIEVCPVCAEKLVAIGEEKAGKVMIYVRANAAWEILNLPKEIESSIAAISNEVHRFTYEEEKEVKEDKSADKDESAELVVTYDVGRKVVLPQTAKFYSCDKDHEKINCFRLDRDYVLPNQQFVWVLLEVEEYIENGERGGKFTAKGKSARCLDDADCIRQARFFNKMPKLTKYEKSIQKAEKPIWLWVECRFGTKLKKGLEFEVNDNGRKKHYRSIAAVEAPERAMIPRRLPDCAEDGIHVRVYCVDDVPKVIKGRPLTKSVEIASTNSITCVEGVAEKIEVTNPKPVIIRQAPKETDQISDSRFVSYLFAKEGMTNLIEASVQDLDIDGKMLGSWFLDSVFSAEDLSGFEKLESSKKRDILMVLKFLQFVKRKEIEESDDADLYSEFETEADKLMRSCRMRSLDHGKPLDCLLKYLLRCNYAYDALRILYKTREL